MNDKHSIITLKNADIWVDDSYLALGIETLLSTYRSHTPNIRFVFFSAEHYFDVLAHHYDLMKHRLIMLIDKQAYAFLNNMPVTRLSIKASADAFSDTLFKLSHRPRQERLLQSDSIELTEREQVFLKLMTEEKNISDIGKSLNLHIKTIYKTRYDLAEKTGCANVTEFLHTFRTNLFKHWLATTVTQRV